MQMTTTTTMSDSAETPLQPAPSGKLSRNFRQTSAKLAEIWWVCLLYTSPSPRD